MAQDTPNNAQELSNARSAKRQYENQRRAYREKISANSQKIARLQTAKEQLAAIKEDLQTASKQQKRDAENADTYHDWDGDVLEKVFIINSMSVPDEYRYYITKVDLALDAIVTVETTLENENLEMYGIVGKLGSWINSLASKIEKMTN